MGGKARASSQKIFVKFKLSSHRGFPPAGVQIAADLNSDGHTDPSDWIDLSRSKLTWHGAKSIGSVDPEGLIVAFSYSATLGAKYEAEVRLRDKDGPKLAFDKDLVQRNQDWLMLSCVVPDEE